MPNPEEIYPMEAKSIKKSFEGAIFRKINYFMMKRFGYFKSFF
jgi:hypothetical protein